MISVHRQQFFFQTVPIFLREVADPDHPLAGLICLAANHFFFPIDPHSTVRIFLLSHHVPGVQFVFSERIFLTPEVAGDDVEVAVLHCCITALSRLP